MKFLQKAVEYNKLAKAFNGYYQMLQNLMTETDSEDFQESLFVVAFIGRKEIIVRIEEYNWNMNNRIVIPMMPSNQKTLAYAFQQTIGRLMTLSEEQGYYSQVQQILDGGELYHYLDRNIPDFIKKLM